MKNTTPNKIRCVGMYSYQEKYDLCDGVFFNDQNIEVVYNQDFIRFEDDDFFGYRKKTRYVYEEISYDIFKALDAYLTNKEYKVKPSLNTKSKLSSYLYQDDDKYFELIIDSKKYIYFIFEIDKSEYHKFIPSHVIKKLIESLKKAGFKQFKICEV